MAIGELTAKVRAKFSRQSAASSQSSAERPPQPDHSRKSTWSLRSRGSHRRLSAFASPEMEQEDARVGVVDTELPTNDRGQLVQGQAGSDQRQTASACPSRSQQSELNNGNTDRSKNKHKGKQKSTSAAESSARIAHPHPGAPEEYEEEHEARQDTIPPQSSERSSASNSKPPGLSRKQSLLPHQQTALIKTLLGTDDIPSPSGAESADYAPFNVPSISASMVSRKIWVKRPGASATLVTVQEDHLVDDVRDMILKKYANTLGRSFDSPDVTLRIVPRENRQERTLGPEEPMCETLDAYFPGGQTVEEALVIDVPLRRTPRPSPQPVPRYYQEEERRPAEAAGDYFPPMPVPTVPSPHLPASHSMSVLTTGHVPSLPSPGAGRRPHRPRLPRQHTPSPTVISGQSQLPPQHAEKSIPTNAPAAPPLPSPPAPQQNSLSVIQQVAPPPPRISSPRPQSRPKKNKKTSSDHPSFPTGMLNGAVPPINVLIVEDNIINLKLLEAFMKRLKVRSQNAMNGREAVTKWRTGGFHLVLMDIQLPIMNGLDATKEIRRLERLNSIGVFTSSAGSSAPPETVTCEPEGDDKLHNTNLFKSPVIIVALTASSLQSDRHEALAAGCNDFLTKPVNFVWLERKVMEWGCMQALIDYDGWRQWKDFSQDSRDDDAKDGKGKGSTSLAAGGSGGKKKKHRASAGSSPNASTSHVSMKEGTEHIGLGLGIDSSESSRSPNHTEHGGER